MTDKEYTTGGEYPGPLHLTTCTGCGEPRRYYGARKGTHCQNCGKPWAEAEAAALFPVQQPGVTAATNGVPFSKPPRIAPDEVRVSRADLRAVLDATTHANRYNDALVCECCKTTWPDWGNSTHAADCAVTRLTAALAASGDDGGTP